MIGKDEVSILTKKVGPVPVWVWLAGGAAILFVMKGKGSKQPSSVPSAPTGPQMMPMNFPGINGGFADVTSADATNPGGDLGVDFSGYPAPVPGGGGGPLQPGPTPVGTKSPTVVPSKGMNPIPVDSNVEQQIMQTKALSYGGGGAAYQSGGQTYLTNVQSIGGGATGNPSIFVAGQSAIQPNPVPFYYNPYLKTYQATPVSSPTPNSFVGSTRYGG